MDSGDDTNTIAKALSLVRDGGGGPGVEGQGCDEVQTLTDANRATWVKEVQEEVESNSQQAIVFSDEKNLHVDTHHVRQDARSVMETKADVNSAVNYCPRSKSGAQTMFFGLVTSAEFTIKPI